MEKKLNLKKGMKVRVIGKPANVDLPGVNATSSASADAVIVFTRTVAEVDAKAGPEAARQDRIAWVAYPKAGQLDTDLNRDVVWKHLLKKGVQAVRQVAIDEMWSALRFRPKK